MTTRSTQAQHDALTSRPDASLAPRWVPEPHGDAGQEVTDGQEEAEATEILRSAFLNRLFRTFGVQEPAPAALEVEAPYLLVLSGCHEGQRIRLRKMHHDLTAGRDPSCEVHLQDSEVSRRHAKLRRTADGLIVTDLGSRNGISVNGERVRGTVRLRPGDELRLATTRLRFADPSMPSGKGAPSPERGAQRLTRSSTQDLPGVRELLARELRDAQPQPRGLADGAPELPIRPTTEPGPPEPGQSADDGRNGVLEEVADWEFVEPVAEDEEAGENDEGDEGEGRAEPGEQDEAAEPEGRGEAAEPEGRGEAAEPEGRGEAEASDADDEPLEDRSRTVLILALLAGGLLLLIAIEAALILSGRGGAGTIFAAA
jgi:hypothetical protein